MTLRLILCEIADRLVTRGDYGAIDAERGWSDVADATAISQAIERIEALSAALVRYGRHSHSCDMLTPMPRESGVVYEYPRDFEAWRATRSCTCGLAAELLEATK